MFAITWSSPSATKVNVGNQIASIFDATSREEMETYGEANEPIRSNGSAEYLNPARSKTLCSCEIDYLGVVRRNLEDATICTHLSAAFPILNG